MKMRDPINPMRDEIRAWAFFENAQEPEQDRDLHLANLREFDLYVELAANNLCPARDYFLRLLYLIVGDAVRTSFQTESLESIKEILAMTESFPRHRFHVFRHRSLELIENPKTFDYDDWCAGKLVARDSNPIQQ
jgi:hypothetical protein